MDKVTRPRRYMFKTETRRDVPENVSMPSRDRVVQDRDYIPAADPADCPGHSLYNRQLTVRASKLS